MDTQLFFIINGHHTAFLDTFFYLVSMKSVWLPLYLALLFMVWRNYSWRGVLYILFMIGVGMLFTDTFNAQLLRPWIGRLRPSNPENPIAPFVHIVYGRSGHGCGFPSAHSANIWLLTMVIAHWFRNRILTITMSITAIIVCYSRVYLGYHYPGDILGGFVLAAIVSFALIWAHKHYLGFSVVNEPRTTWLPAIVVSITIITFLAIAFCMD